LLDKRFVFKYNAWVICHDEAIMFRSTRSLSQLSALTFIAFASLPTCAETWVDNTGKYSIDAQFVAVKGRSIVLLKADGSKVTVPIARLNAASRAQAKAIYQRLTKEATKNQGVAASDSSTPVLPARTLNFTPPTPPVASWREPFPDNLSLQQTLEIVKRQLLDGHPEVFWYALPQEMRDTIDHERVHSAVSPFFKRHGQMLSQVEQLVFKVIEVLVTKKQFVLEASMLQQLPPSILSSVTEGYDSAVGILYELTDLGFALDSIGDKSITQMIDYYAPRIGAHAKTLLPLAPPGAVEELLDGITMEMIDKHHAIIRLPESENPDSGDPDEFSPASSVETQFHNVKITKYLGRWLPSDFVDHWDEWKAKLEGDLKHEIEQAEQAHAEQTQGAMMMAGMFTGMVETVLDSLLAADTQEQFDQGLLQATSILNLSGEADGGEGIKMEFSTDTEDRVDPDGLPNNTEEDEVTDPSGPAPEGWTLDLSNSEIPGTACSGVANGNEIAITEASIRGGILHLNSAAKQNKETAFVVFTFLDDDENIEGKTFEIGPKSGFSSPHIHFRYPTGKGGKTEMFMQGYAMRLEFGQRSGNKLPGKIYLCLPDSKKSLIAGTFEATCDE
jgi:hypothetical protein